MAVQPQTPYIEHIANGTTTGFNLGFDCDDQDHLIVLVDDVEPVVGSWSLTGGAVVFGAAPTSGNKITIQRNTPFERKRDYQSYDNSFRPPAVNNDFDHIWLKTQELGVADWLLLNKLQKFRDDVNLTALEETLEQAKEIRDDTADSVIEVQSNVAQSQALLADTATKANQAQSSATAASTANTAAQQALVQANAAEGNVYAALSAQTATVNTALVGFTNGASKWYATLALAEADIANIGIKDKVDIGEVANGGTWYKATAGATSLTKSPYDPLTQAKADATTKANAAEANAKGYADSNKLDLKQLTVEYKDGNMLGVNSLKLIGTGLSVGRVIVLNPDIDSAIIPVVAGDVLYIHNNLATYSTSLSDTYAFFALNPAQNTAQTRIPPVTSNINTDPVTAIKYMAATVPENAKFLMLNVRSSASVTQWSVRKGTWIPSYTQGAEILSKVKDILLYSPPNIFENEPKVSVKNLYKGTVLRKFRVNDNGAYAIADNNAALSGTIPVVFGQSYTISGIPRKPMGATLTNLSST